MQQGRIPGALAMDVRTGAAVRLPENILLPYRLEDYIECRLSDGLKAIYCRRGRYDYLCRYGRQADGADSYGRHGQGEGSG